MDEYTRIDAFADFDYFIRQMHFFYQEYGAQYIVIQHEKCIGVFKTEEEATSFINNNCLRHRCIMYKCFDLSSVYNPYKYNFRG